MSSIGPAQHFGDLQWPRRERNDLSWLSRLLNRVLAKLRSPVLLSPRFDHNHDMVSLEQADNIQLLAQGVLDHKVPGAFVELGSYTGSTAAILSRSIASSGRELHVFDRFDIDLGDEPEVRGAFDSTMARYAPQPAIVHAGDLFATVPAELPAAIAFAHVDLGVGGDPELHRSLIEHALVHVFERLSTGGVLLLMDHHVPGVTVHGNDSNPAVRAATEPFFAKRGLTVRTLYGGPCSHAYVRKP